MCIIIAGHKAYSLYARLYSVVIALAALSSLFHSTRSLVIQSGFALASISLVGFHLFLASCSPVPPLYDRTIGAFIAVSHFKMRLHI